jgi:hypothetical protein
VNGAPEYRIGFLSAWKGSLLEFYHALYLFQGMPEKKSGLFKGTIYITYRLERTSLYAFKQKGRPLFFKYLPVNFGHLEVRIYLFFDSDKSLVAFKVINGGPEG